MMPRAASGRCSRRAGGIGRKHEVVVPTLPRRLLRDGQVPHRLDRMDQCHECGAGAMLPPVIDQHVQGIERADVVPPDRRNEDRVPGLELGDFGLRQRCGKARVAFQIGRIRIDHARRRTGHGVIERTDIQVGELIGREQREPSSSGYDAGDVDRGIVVRGDPRRIADPQPRRRIDIERERVGRFPTRQMLGGGRGVGVERVRAGRRCLRKAQQLGHQRADRHLLAVEVEPGHRVVGVEEPPLGFGRCDHHVERLAPCRSKAREILRHRAVASARSADRLPAGDLTAQHDRSKRADNLAREGRGIDCPPLGNTPFDHG